MRKKEFRVAFIELLLRKSVQDAEEFHRRLFGSRNNTMRQKIGQEGEGQEQNAENENASHPNDNDKDNPGVHASGANFEDKNATATTTTQSRPTFDPNFY